MSSKVQNSAYIHQLLNHKFTNQIKQRKSVLHLKLTVGRMQCNYNHASEGSHVEVEEDTGGELLGAKSLLEHLLTPWTDRETIA